jgi:hypothetical protein
MSNGTFANEALYGEFIKRHHTLPSMPRIIPGRSRKLVTLYGVLGRIRLISADEVLQGSRAMRTANR